MCISAWRATISARGGAVADCSFVPKVQWRAPAARVFIAFALLAMLFVCVAPRGAQAQSCVGTADPCFQGLGFLAVAYPYSYASGINPDGSVVVGWSYDSTGNEQGQAFSWSGGTMTGLGRLGGPNSTADSNASAVNAQGVIVGDSYDPTLFINNCTESFPEAATFQNGPQGLGFLSTSICPAYSIAVAIASQANVAVGYSYDSNGATEAVIFQGGGVTGLGVLDPSNAYSVAYGVNSNGSVIVGESLSSSGIYEAVVWQGGGMTVLKSLSAQGRASYASAVNADGSVVVGMSGTISTINAVRWVNGVIADLGIGTAYAVNADGNVVVGTGIFDDSVGAFRWTPVDGFQSIPQVLTAAGVSIPSGWSLLSAQGVSADGTTITGYGTDPNGNFQAWIARLPLPSECHWAGASSSRAMPAQPGPGATGPTFESRDPWRAFMAQVPMPQKGCFTATYPDSAWHEVPCTTAPKVPFPPARGPRSNIIGNGTDYSAAVRSHISTATGSFCPTGVTSESGYVNGEPPAKPNVFSLQLNSNTFTSAACNGAANPPQCQAWQQFVFSQTGCAGPCAFIQYWLINYGTTNCPKGWIPSNNNCYMSSTNAVPSPPAQRIENLGNLSMTAKAVSGGNDTLIFSTGNQLYTVQNEDSVIYLALGWQATEFNIFGDCCGSEANFNAGSTIIVRTAVDAGLAKSSSCAEEGFTGETNNLSLVRDPTPPPPGDLAPEILFMESNSPSGQLGEYCYSQ
jgi:probable HAF family extracellular repeat protein